MKEMKDSGIEWIGEIPKHWKTTQLKRLATIQTGNTPSKTQNDIFYSDISGCLWIKAEDLGRNEPIIKTTEYLTDIGKKEGRIFPPNTVFVCCIASVGKVGYCEQEASCNQQINGLVFYNAYWKYGYYLSMAQESEYLLNASGNVMKIINSDKQSNLDCPLPIFQEQKAIADFLDKRCSEIDSVIEQTKATIEEYKALKQSIITEAVTNGVRGDRPMKDSGIEWIGEIPAEWDIGKVGYFFEVQLGKMLQPNQESPEDTLEYYLCAANVGKNTFKPSPLKQMWFNPNEYKVFDVQNGDLVVVEGGDVASCAIVNIDIPRLFIQNALHRVRSKDDSDIRILKYWLWSAKGIGHIDLICNKATIAHFSKEKFISLPYIVIPISEQKEIADYLDQKCAEIDTLIEKKTALLEEMEALKKSTIFEYVTGKKKVTS